MHKMGLLLLIWDVCVSGDFIFLSCECQGFIFLLHCLAVQSALGAADTSAELAFERLECLNGLSDMKANSCRGQVSRVDNSGGTEMEKHPS